MIFRNSRGSTPWPGVLLVVIAFSSVPHEMPRSGWGISEQAELRMLYRQASGPHARSGFAGSLSAAEFKDRRDS